MVDRPSASAPPPRTGAATGRSASWLLVLPLEAAGEHVLLVVGEADLSTSPGLCHQLLAAIAGGPPELRVDLADLDFCDLHGLDALHAGESAAREAGIPLTLSGMSAQLAWLYRTFPDPGRRRPSPRRRSSRRSAG